MNAQLPTGEGAGFRIRHPLPFGRHDVWPGSYTLTDAIKELQGVGNLSAEIVDARGQVVIHSTAWWMKEGRKFRGRMS